MEEEETLINRVSDAKGVRYNITGTVDAAWDKFVNLGFVGLSLKGHENSLFKCHQSFNNAAKAPGISKLKALRKLAEIDMKRCFNALLNGLLEGIFRLNFTEDSTNDENTQDKPYLQGVLMTFLPYPAVSFNEIHLEYSSSKHLVGGSYDVIVGSETNGEKPKIHIEGINVAVHLGCLLEAKSTCTRLAPSTSESSSFTDDSADLKKLIQPMLEVMAISQVATFPNPDVPVVNFLAHKFVFRPLVYFRDVDVLVTTPRVIHLRHSENTIDVLGLITMFTFLQLHWTKGVKFQRNAIIELFPTSGWTRALQQGKDGYHTSKLTVVGMKKKFPHVGSKPFIHESSSSEDERSAEADEKERVPKRSHPSPESSICKRSKT